MPATMYPKAFTVSADIDAGGLYNIQGFFVRETAGATAVVKFYDAQSATGSPVLSLNLIANQSVGDVWATGMRIKTGIYVEVTGTVEGGVYVS